MVINQNINTNFTKVSNAFLQDRNISGDAKMIGVLLMSFPRNWEVNIKHLSELLQKGEQTIRKGIRELINAGKLKVGQHRENNGKFSNSMCYELVGEVEEELLENELLDGEKVQNTKDFNTLIKSEIDLRKYPIKNNELSDFSESYPFDKKTDNGDFVKHIKNNINYKDYKSIRRERKIYFDLSNLFFKSKNKNLKQMPENFSKEELQAFSDFIKYRKERDKRMSCTTLDAIIKHLEALKAKGEDIVKVTQQSIERGWSGLFPLTENKYPKTRKKAPNTQQGQQEELSKEHLLHEKILNTILEQDESFNLERLKGYWFVDYLDMECVAVKKNKNGYLEFVKEELQEKALYAL